MVRAILEGRKTQTRRALKPKHLFHESRFGPNPPIEHCPYGQPGDRLWVRETWGIALCGSRIPLSPEAWPEGWPIDRLRYAADGVRLGTAVSRPSIHMPRWASRLLLEITAVRVERLQEISDGDARAEGCAGGQGSIRGYSYSATPAEHFSHVWRELYGDAGWQANPWVWVIDYKRSEAIRG